MIAGGSKIAGKYFRIELLFLLFISYFTSIISDLEYSYYEEGNIWNFTKALELRLVYGTFSFILYSVYYWLVLKPLLFRNQVFYLLLSAVGFVVVYSICNKYDHWVVTKLGFLSEELREGALENYLKVKVRFVINYLLSYVLFTLFGFAYVIRSLQQDEEVKALKEQQLITELNYLKAQLQPHFFFNTLNNIYALASRGAKETAPMVAKLSQMMRYIIYESNHTRVPLSQEIEFLKNYIEIEKIRRPATIGIDFDVQGFPDIHQIEPLLLLPLVENAFKHGVEDETGEGFVRVIIDISESELTLQVENSKPVSVYQKQSGGIGLQNITKRLNLLYHSRHELKAGDAEQLYRVTLTLQLT